MQLPRISATTLMTENPRTVRMSDPISEAVEVLQTLEFRHLPVLDDDQNLVGIVSDRDLRPFLVLYAQDAETVGGALKHGRLPVSSIMSSNVVSVDPEADVTELMELMLEHKIGAVPVVDGDGMLVGIVSYVDLLRGLLS
ncbi:CBS domain-containing protein [Chondromyces crocatus]|uniref:CBS domain-containing protein n=1 Tax=Chondromyces crocatus TaxID=52 RepID=A0A0K1EKM5_CHOCO|nr:CBS domain-containing protein [Chondromyces crocatus]AKT41207.1 uncharacterized protein CMC5_053680 [Chondromyces crocatus]